MNEHDREDHDNREEPGTREGVGTQDITRDLQVVPGRGSEYGVVHLKVSEGRCGLDLTRAVSDVVNVSIERLKELIQLGSVYVNDVRSSSSSQLIHAQDHIRIHLNPRRYYNAEASRGAIANRIVRIDEDFFVVDKPSGLPVHALVDNAREDLLEILRAEFGPSVFITHRLDIETSGMILFARNPVAQSRFNALIKQKKIRRRYSAFVTEPVALEHHVHFMEPGPKAPKKVVPSMPHPTWLRCEMVVQACRRVELGQIERLWKVLDPPMDSEIYELEIELVTGRPQQIRSQLTFLGAPIVGDQTYGGEGKLCDWLTTGPAIALRATALEFENE